MEKLSRSILSKAFLIVLCVPHLQANDLFESVNQDYLKQFIVPNDGKAMPVQSEAEKPKKPQLVSVPLEEGAKRQMGFEILRTTVPADNNSIIDTQFVRSMELISGGKDGKSSLFNAINRTNDIMSEVNLAWQLVNPSADIEQAKATRLLVEELVTKSELLQKLKSLFQKLKESEEAVLSFWAEEHPTNKKILEQVYFSWLPDACNKNSACLELGSSLSCAKNGLIIGFPITGIYLFWTLKALWKSQLNWTDVSTWKKHIKNMYSGTKAAVSTAWHYKGELTQAPELYRAYVEDSAQQGANALEQALGAGDASKVWGKACPTTRDEYIQNVIKVTPYTHAVMAGIVGALLGIPYYKMVRSATTHEADKASITHYMQSKLIHVATYVDTLKEIDTLLQSNEVFKKHFTGLGQLHALQNPSNKEFSADCTTLLSLLNTNTFKGKTSYWFSIVGRIYAAYKLMPHVKNELSGALVSGGRVGALVSAAHLYLQHQDTPVKYCFVDYVEGTQPRIDARDVWNPRVSTTQAVANTIQLGGEQRSHMILTGGNGLGKSTVMKAIPYAMVTASLGIAPAQHFTITPFARVMCHMNVSDDIATGMSGFTAELQLKDKVVNELPQLKDNQFTFIVLDELFRSTNPTDAASLTTTFASHIASYKNTISILATHYEPVIGLENQGTHVNYHMGSIAQSNGLPPKPTYRLEPGASLEHNAVALYNAGKSEK